jgi:hypothetical protein
MDFAYQWSFGMPWNDFDRRDDTYLYREHNFTYPTVNGVIDTIAWEGFREANYDTRYADTLQAYIKDANAMNTVDSLAAARAGSEYLVQLKQQLKRASGDKQYTDYFVADFDAIRKNLISHIRAIRSSMGLQSSVSCQ